MNKQIIEIPKTTSQKMAEEKEKMRVYQILTESKESIHKKRKKAITVRVLGVKYNENAKTPEIKYGAECLYEDWHIFVPASEMGFDEDFSNMSSEQRINIYKSYIKKMEMASIDVVIYGVDSTNKIAVGSRKAAMEDKRERHYFKSDKNGESLMERTFRQGKFPEARIITITGSTVMVEVLGYVTKVIAKNVEHRFIEQNRLKDIVHVGEIVPVKILHLAIDKENKLIDMEVSIKDAKPNLQKINMAKFTVGSSIVGTVTGIHNGYFVQIGDFKTGIDVFCKRVLCLEMPSRGDLVSVTISIKDEEKGRVYGVIEEIKQKADSLRTVA